MQQKRSYGDGSRDLRIQNKSNNMSEKPITGHVSQMRKSNKYLGAIDFMNRGKVKLEIEEVYEFTGEILSGGRKSDGNSLKFKGTERRAILNSTKKKLLAACFGPTLEDWKGKTIHIEAVPGKKNPNGGDPVWGLDFFAEPDLALLKANRAAMVGGSK